MKINLNCLTWKYISSKNKNEYDFTLIINFTNIENLTWSNLHLTRNCVILTKFKKKIVDTKMWSEAVNWRRTNNAMTKRKINKEKKKCLQSTTRRTEDWTTRTHLKPVVNSCAPGRANSSCSTNSSRRVTRVKKSTISHDWGKNNGIVNLSLIICDWVIITRSRRRP